MEEVKEKIKKHETIACCGLDCGLCPRHYTKGTSRCGGCGSCNFAGNPSCFFLNCCAVKKGLEVCAECAEYPCERFRKTSNIGCDSFTTHKKILVNLEDIKINGLANFLGRQKIRIGVLEDLLANHDDGRTKSFYCISCTLLPIEKLQEVQKAAKDMIETVDLKDRCKHIRALLTEIANTMDIALRLDKKS